MGQVFTRQQQQQVQTQRDENAGDTTETNLYRSRSSRSFADITVGKFRRNLQRVRRYFTRKPRGRLENIELSPMATSESQVKTKPQNLKQFS